LLTTYRIYSMNRFSLAHRGACSRDDPEDGAGVASRGAARNRMFGRHGNRPPGTCMGLSVSRSILVPSPCSTLAAISSSRPATGWPLRAVAVKGGRRPSRSDLPLTVASTAAGWVGRGCLPAVGRPTTIPRELAIARGVPRQTCIRSIRWDRTMMQSYASAAKLRAAGPF
jgi:hypothetical protein